MTPSRTSSEGADLDLDVYLYAPHNNPFQAPSILRGWRVFQGGCMGAIKVCGMQEAPSRLCCIIYGVDGKAI